MNVLLKILEQLRAKKKPEPVHIYSNRELLYNIAIAWLGRDASPYDLAPDELGCAESLTSLIAQVDSSIRWTNKLATAWVFKDMVSGRHFKQITTPSEGDIIISPTKWDITGHCGIVGKNGIVMSNNSFKDSSGARGIFDENYTLASWRRYFVDKKGLRTFFFRIL